MHMMTAEMMEQDKLRTASEQVVGEVLRRVLDRLIVGKGLRGGGLLRAYGEAESGNSEALRKVQALIYVPYALHERQGIRKIKKACFTSKSQPTQSMKEAPRSNHSTSQKPKRPEIEMFRG